MFAIEREKNKVRVKDRGVWDTRSFASLRMTELAFVGKDWRSLAKIGTLQDKEGELHWIMGKRSYEQNLTVYSA